MWFSFALFACPRRFVLCTAGSVFVAAVAASLAPAQEPTPQATAPAVDFSREVRPILAERCEQCHGAKKQEGGLRLDRKSAALKGGDNYAPAIVPGKSDESPLWRFVAKEDADLQMPPEGERLSAAQTETLKRWIDQGAKWPDDAVANETKHWAFEPIVRRPLPEARTRVGAVLLLTAL